MTTELTKAAQQALEALEQGVAWKEGGLQKARAAIDALRFALSQRPAAQEVSTDVRTILLDVVPGPDGMGHEVYAKNVDDVVAKLTELAEQVESLKAELDDMTASRDEALHAPWPEWAEKIKARVRESSGYDGFDDLDGVDLPEEVNEHLCEIERQNERLREQLASLPAPQQATPDQFADASKMVSPVALRSVRLTRDTAGMCVVRVNGRVAIRDNGDIIDHIATLEWFADTQQATPEPVGEPFVATYSSESIGGKQHDTGRVNKGTRGGFFASTASPEDARLIADALNAYTRPAAAPAPAVPEGWRDAKNDPPPIGVDVLVAVEFDRPGDWRIKVGGRNPQERTGWCVFGASWVPQVWMPLDAHRAMLAAAQAKGGE